MTTSPEPAQVPLMLAELRYYDIPRDAWARMLLRARQLGVHSVAAAVRWKWHAPSLDLIDFDGASDPQSDLIGFINACARLNLALTLDFGVVAGDSVPAAELPAWLTATPLSEHERGVNTSRHVVERLEAARNWVAACSRALLRYQAPAGPIVALRHSGDSLLAGWLREEGWKLPIVQADPNHSSRPGDPEATWLDSLAGAAILHGAARPTRASASRAAAPLLRPDGSVRSGFWRAKSLRMLVGAAGADCAAARAPADLALIAHAQSARLAERLVAARMTFDQIAPAEATAERLARYALIIGPAALAEQPLLQETLANCANLALIGEWSGERAPAPLLGRDVSADQVGELIEARGGHARYAWADNSALELSVRYGPEYTYLVAHNRQPLAYNGMLAYRAPSGEVLHLHIGLGAGRAGFVMLREDEVVGVACDGDGSEGGWLARGLTSSVVFNAGAGGVIPCGDGLLITSSQSGRFQIRRGSGWSAMRAYRLLLSGELIEARAQFDAAHILLPYIAEDEGGQTDLYLVLPERQSLPPALRDDLAAPLQARALELEAAAELVGQVAGEAVPFLERAVGVFAAGATRLDTLDDYAATWRQAAEAIQAAAVALQDERPGAPRADEHTLGRIVRLMWADA